MDVAKVNMRREGRTVLNEADLELAMEQFSVLFELAGGPEGWLELLAE